MDIYSIGEMVIDFIPGEEKGSYIRNVLQGWRRLICKIPYGNAEKRRRTGHVQETL